VADKEVHCWRITPDNCLVGTPCSVTAMACAMERDFSPFPRNDSERIRRFIACSGRIVPRNAYEAESRHCIEKRYTDVHKYYSDELKDDGYLSLDGFNRMVRKFFPVKKKLYFKRNERPTLQDYLANLEDDAFICVKGHYIYADTYCDGYWSFFDNAQDPVICVWLLTSE